MEPWRKVWREGFAPGLPTEGLKSLRVALEIDDIRLIQGATVGPPSLGMFADYEIESADALCWCGWHGLELDTVGEVEEFFARLCHEADARLKEVAACRWFLNWYDDNPRGEVRRELIGEVDLVLASRGEPIERHEFGVSV